MPPVTPNPRSKRKQASAGDEPQKRRRRSSSESTDDVGARVLLMEQRILESKKNYNDIPALLSAAHGFRQGKPESAAAVVALCRVFVRLLSQGSLVMKTPSSEKDTVVVRWLKGQLFTYKQLLLSSLKDEAVAMTTLTLCMRIIKAEGEQSPEKEEYTFSRDFFKDLILGLISSNNEDLIQEFVTKYAEEYDDIRYYTFMAVKAALDGSGDHRNSRQLFDSGFALISAFDAVPESAEDLEDFYIQRPQSKGHGLRSVHQHRRQGQEAWLALIGIAESKDQGKRILNIISTVIAPWFTKPELLADFLTNSYDSGGSMSLLAMSGVFYLIQERNLDYPSFYPKLYSLLDQDILHSKHRSRFFRLLDTFLASTHLPAALVASFIKRLSRLSLNAPPSAIVFVVPWVYNLLRRHPLCTFMIHREIRDPEEREAVKQNGFADPFLSDEPDPMKTKAIDSCLWELVQLQSHFHPNVATIARIMSEQFTKQSYNIEDFLDHSYASLLGTEVAKQIKKAPVVEYQIPKRIFSPQAPSAGTEDSLLVRLWDFQGSTGAGYVESAR